MAMSAIAPSARAASSELPSWWDTQYQFREVSGDDKTYSYGNPDVIPGWVSVTEPSMSVSIDNLFDASKKKQVFVYVMANEALTVTAPQIDWIKVVGSDKYSVTSRMNWVWHAPTATSYGYGLASIDLIPQPSSEVITFYWNFNDPVPGLAAVKYDIRTNCVPVPEPASIAMLLAGLGVLVPYARKRSLKPAG